MIGSPAFWLVLLSGAGWTAVAPARWRDPVLAALAAALLTYHDPLLFVIYLGMAALSWMLIRRGRASRMAIGMIAALAVGLVGSKLAQASEGLTVGPLGLSYLIFRLIHVLIESQRGQLPRLGASEFAHYLWSPAMLAAGPVERLEHFVTARVERPDGQLGAEIVQRLTIGLAKKLLLADWLIVLVMKKFGVETATLTPQSTPGTLWLASLLCYIRIYAEFSGYSDIAIGAGLLWGRRLMENFNWPILATTPSDFWRRWHISLSQWCGRYVYMPAIGRLRSPLVPMFGSFLVIGLWHSIGWNRFAWAMYQTAGVMVQIGWNRVVGRPQPATWRLRWPWRMASWLMTQSFVTASYVFVLEPRIEASLPVLARMLGVA